MCTVYAEWNWSLRLNHIHLVCPSLDGTPLFVIVMTEGVWSLLTDWYRTLHGINHSFVFLSHSSEFDVFLFSLSFWSRQVSYVLRRVYDIRRKMQQVNNDHDACLVCSCKKISDAHLEFYDIFRTVIRAKYLSEYMDELFDIQVNMTIAMRDALLILLNYCYS